ncbi:hypothetical protein MJH12_08005 [bacterium]|nr:hypothetical protein [bacterium]
MYRFKIKTLFGLLIISNLLFLTGCDKDKTQSPKEQLHPVITTFLELIKKNEITDAYYLTHPKFQKASSLSDFHRLAKFYKLTKITSYQFDQITIKKQTGKMIGSLIYQDDSEIPITFGFGEDVKKFKVLHLDLDLKSYFENNGMVLPNRNELKSLVSKTFKKFHSSCRRGSMKDFYKTISSVWKDQMETYELDDIYSQIMISSFVKHSFKEFKVKLDPISGMNNSGILICTGSIHSDLSISFEFQYYFEDGQFKPLSINVRLLK